MVSCSRTAHEAAACSGLSDRAVRPLPAGAQRHPYPWPGFRRRVQATGDYIGRSTGGSSTTVHSSPAISRRGSARRERGGTTTTGRPRSRPCSSPVASRRGGDRRTSRASMTYRSGSSRPRRSPAPRCLRTRRARNCWCWPRSTTGSGRSRPSPTITASRRRCKPLAELVEEGRLLPVTVQGGPPGVPPPATRQRRINAHC